MKKAYKVKKVVYLVSIAYGFCLQAGFYEQKHITPLAKNKHGYRSKRLFRTGLDRLRTMMERKK